MLQFLVLLGVVGCACAVNLAGEYIVTRSWFPWPDQDNPDGDGTI